MNAVETHAKGSVLSKKAVETQVKGSGNTRQRQCRTGVRPECARASTAVENKCHRFEALKIGDKRSLTRPSRNLHNSGRGQ